MTSISEPIVLRGSLVDLFPMEVDHFDDLLALSKDKRIWQHYIVDGSDTIKMRQHLEAALKEKEKGRQYPFTIQKKDGTIIGSTRFLDIQPEHRKLEIGWTWLHPDYWGTRMNTECKKLLIQHCFETLHTVRIQLRTDENNIRSRKAIEKIGAQLEGILRNDMLRENGTKRHSAYYSIIDSEWPSVKKTLGRIG